MKNLTQLPWSGKCSKAKNDNTLGRMHGGIRSMIDSTMTRQWLDTPPTTSRVWRYVAMLLMVLTLGVGEMWGATSSTFYFAIDAATIGDNCNNVKFCIKYGSNEWSGDQTMAKQNATYNGKLVYKATYSFSWDGYYNWQFMNGTSLYREVYAGSWNTDLHNGKIYDYDNETWYTYSADASYSIYFVNNNDWANPKAYAYNSNCDYNTAWSGAAISSSTSKTLNGKTIYKIDFSKRYANVIFSNNGANQTADLTLGTTNAGKMWDGDSWETYQFDITLDQQSGSGGTSSVIGVVGSAMPGSKTAPTRTGYTFGGYYTSTGGSGTCYYNASMVSQTNVSASTPNTLYAKWTKKTFTVTVNDDGHGSTSPSGAQSSIAQVDGIAISAEADDDYEFVNWTIESGTGSFTDATDESTTFYPTSTATIQANFRSTLTNSLTVVAGSGISSVTGSTDPVTLGNSYAITATPISGYSFSTWTADIPANASFASATSASTNVTVSNGSVTVTASATEDKVTLTPTVSYDHGSSNYTASSSNTVGVTTTTNLSCSSPNAAHYTFAGWTLTNLTVTSGDASTDRNITVKITTPGSAIAAVANYEEVLTTSWYIAGDNGDAFSGWGTSGTRMEKKSGYSTVEKYYCTISPASTAIGDGFAFQAYNSSNDTYYGYNNRQFKKDQNSCTLYSGNPNNMRFLPYLLGDYEFELDNTGANPVLTVTWPVINQLRISSASPTDASNTGNYDLGAAVSNVRSVTRSLKANTTYTFKIVYNSDWYGKNSGALTRSTSTSSNTLTDLSTSGGDMTLTTDYAGDYTFKFNQSTKSLSVDYPTAYQVSLNVGNVEGNKNTPIIYKTSVDNANKVSNGTWLASGTKVIFWAANDANAAKAGYDWWGFYDNATGANPTKYTNNNVGLYTVNSLSSNMTVYAVFGEKDYTVKIVNNGNGDVYEGGSIVTATTAHVATASNTLTATPQTGYKFDSWDQFSDSLTINSPSTASTTIKIKDTKLGNNARLRANYSPQWSVLGSGAFGGWEAYSTNLFTGYTKVSTKDVGYKTITLAANTNYEIKVYDRKNSTWYGGSANQDITYATSGSGNEYTIATTSSPKSVFIQSAAGGSYTLNWNLTDKKIAVVYPESWYITSGQNDADGGSFTAIDNSSNNVKGGKFVARNATVTFTATPATGYNFSGWYSNSTCTTAYTAGTNVALSGDGNSVLTLSSITANKEAYAKFTPKTYNVALDMQSGATGYGSGSNRNEIVTYNATLTTVGSLPTAANGYAFMGFYSGTGGRGTQFINASGTWATSVTDTISDSKWVLDAGATLYAYYKKAEITELTLVDAIVAQSVTNGVKVTPTISPTPTGTTHIDWRVLYSNGNPLASQPSMTAYNTTGVQFTSPETSGSYLIEAVLRTGSTANAGTTIDSTTASFQVAGTHTVTIRYQDSEGNTLQASGSVTARPLEWTDAIDAPEIFGYTFDHWLAGDGVTLSEDGEDALGDDESNEVTIYIKAVYDGRLTAVYNQNQMIYFKNTLGWDTVLVNFYTGSYWNNPLGSGNRAVTNRNKGMNRVAGTTDIWYYDYGAAGITPSLYVSFTNMVQNGADAGGHENFYNASPHVQVVYPANYQDAIHTDKSSENGFKAATPMFVPLADQTKTTLNTHADYYNRGYWTKYVPGTGYTLEVYNSAGNVLLKSFEFTSADELMPMKAVADLDAATTYKFQIRRGGTDANGIYYGNSGTMTNTNHGQDTPWDLTNRPSFSMVTIKTTATGDYTFNLSYSANASSQYRLRVAVDYPASIGDFQVLYSDTTSWSYGQHAAAWRHPSRVIAARANGKDTISFFVYKGKKPAINARKVSEINASTGAITWAATNIGSSASQSLESVTATGVYNFEVVQNAAGDAITAINNIGEYTGNYYIRTDGVNNKWDSYRSADHIMTYSEYSKTYSDYTHYFMAYVNNGTNIKFTIANDYSACVTDTLIQQTFRGGDASHVDEDGNVQADANVRFMWDIRYNRLIRAYLAAAKNDGSKFLVLRANSSEDMMDVNGNALVNSANEGEDGYNHKAPDNSMQFVDNENWIYETNIKIKPGAFVKLYAYFNSAYFYYKGEDNNTFDAENAINLMTGTGSAQLIRVIYDFKTDRLVAAWEPSGEIDGERAINADVMFVREHQGDIAQLTFTESGKITEINTAYGVLRFNKWTLNNKSKTGSHTPVSPALSPYERDLFYVSFPFRVAMNEVFGFGTYAKHWIIEEYDGAGRAANGFWADSESYWKFVTDRKGKYFEPNQGYIIALDLDELGESSDVWDNGVENVELYFPSYGTMPSITSSSVEHTLPTHECTINRPTAGGDRRIKDSHWNVMSVPTYVNTSSITFANTEWTAAHPNYLYEWNPNDNSLTARSGSGYTYHAMHAYMVQYAGKVTWTSTSVSPSPVIARSTYLEEAKEIEFRLEIMQGENAIDQTFVRMSNDEQVSASFAFGEDMSKEFNNGRANIYTMISSVIDNEKSLTEAAGNVLPMTEQTTVVPVGVKIVANDDYTFSIPEGTEGVGVTLIDTETGIRTSLSALDYTVSLETGTYNNRFVLEISPIQNIATEIEGVESQKSKVESRKLLIDGLLYIVRDNKVYDARGARVE